MKIYYSGSAGAIKGGKLPAEPESVLKNKANIMLSYHLITEGNQDQHKRWPAILQARQEAKR